MSTTRVLGLDLSLTSTGIAHPDGTLETLKPPDNIRGCGRLELLRNTIRSRALVPRPHLVAVEGYAHARPNQAHQIGELGGVIRLTLFEAGIDYIDVPPATLKKLATGRGNATKPDMRMALYKRTGIDVSDDNQVDAAWLRILGLTLLGHPEIALPATQLDALNKIKRPEGISS